MSFTLDACIAALILTISLTYFVSSTMSAITVSHEHYDDSLIVMGRLLRHYDLQIAIYTNNSAMIDPIIYSAINAHHDYYLAVVDPESQIVIMECGTPRLSNYLVSVTLPGWNGTLKPRTLCFRVGVRG